MAGTNQAAREAVHAVAGKAMTPKPLPVIIGVGIAVLAMLYEKSSYDRHQRELGALEFKIGVLSQDTLRLKHDSDSLKSAFRVDTVKLTRSILKRDTVLATVEHFLHDTVKVPVQVLRDVIRVDSLALNACLVSLSTCEQRLAVKNAQITNLTTQRDLWRKAAQPSWFRRTSSTFGKVGIGFVIGYAVKR